MVNYQSTTSSVQHKSNSIQDLRQMKASSEAQDCGVQEKWSCPLMLLHALSPETNTSHPQGANAWIYTSQGTQVTDALSTSRTASDSRTSMQSGHLSFKRTCCARPIVAVEAACSQVHPSQSSSGRGSITKWVKVYQTVSM